MSMVKMPYSPLNQRFLYVPEKERPTPLVDDEGKTIKKVARPQGRSVATSSLYFSGVRGCCLTLSRLWQRR